LDASYDWTGFNNIRHHFAPVPKLFRSFFILLKCRLEIVTAISSGSKLPSIPKNAIMVLFAVAFIDQSDERKPIGP